MPGGLSAKAQTPRWSALEDQPAQATPRNARLARGAIRDCMN
jgi:hypothetical protein